MWQFTPFQAYVFVLGGLYWPLTLVGTVLFSYFCYRVTSIIWRAIFFVAAAILIFPLAWFWTWAFIIDVVG